MTPRMPRRFGAASTDWWAAWPAIATVPAAWAMRSGTSARSHRSYRPGLFHCYAVPDLPRTNNDLEHEFGSQRYHERRATGRKTASPAVVLRGEARLVAAVATRRQLSSGPDLGRADRGRWKELRQRLDQRRYARTLRTRFRRDPAAYLAELEEKACQLILP